MVRVPRRTHSVSGPPTVHCMWKDVACCCNVVKINDFYTSMMALRRNPQRRCKRELLGTPVEAIGTGSLGLQRERSTIGPSESPRTTQRTFTSPQPFVNSTPPVQPFRFFDLPREVRDHVYSYVVLSRGRKIPIIEAKAVLRGQKKRAAAQRTRDRLNLKRAQCGRRPIATREATTDAIVHLNLLRASRSLYVEASDYLYQNWFAISLDNFPITVADTPSGWNFGRITKMQLELQLKDAQRMNSYIDWTTFFAAFPALRVLRIIPTFHPRYYDWAHAELRDWAGAHFIFRAFFRELLAAIPDRIQFKLGTSLDPENDMQLEGRCPVAKPLLQQIYFDLGVRGAESLCYEGRYLATTRVVDVE